MQATSSLTTDDREAAVALFAAGYGWRATATRLGVSPTAVQRLHARWRIWGERALTPQPTRRRVGFETKREIVRRCLAGETKAALAAEYALSSPQLVATWVRIVRAVGEDGLRPKERRQPSGPVAEASEVARLRRENERLRAEVAYLGKLQALGARTRR